MQKAQNNNIFLNNKINPLIRDFKAKKACCSFDDNAGNTNIGEGTVRLTSSLR
jgi:hypothetical protein